MKGSSALGGRVDRIPAGHREGRGQGNQGSSQDFGQSDQVAPGKTEMLICTTHISCGGQSPRQTS